MNNNIKIKVCGMRDVDNIRQLVQLPIDYIGFIFYPKSPRFVQDQAPPINAADIKKVGVFVNSTFSEIMDKVHTHQLDAVQLHGDETPQLCESLKNQKLEIIKAFGIDCTFDWFTLESYLEHIDYFLFDTKSTQYGGTGKTFSWSALTEYPYNKPYFLSGGLGPDNLQDAFNINDNRLYAVDLNSRFEQQPGIKNIETLTQALSIIRNEQIPSKQ
ncbi:phosphoribosylanthranilate isomerase [Sphingobacterium faecale]|uniref:N-(5'-phosphoribosyl)anthranilate isomerase n=1 Tax=Sphingobacterium faecale TaxID=2803775 RepID=A0ABS1QZK0_9SPHI|nr:phosphoribosylanthranilate isomerase [Sphingobacterium faecale]MBL1407863.1 phosphoribosylanthranilate isomerase [Sphingobacterium faecale]